MAHELTLTEQRTLSMILDVADRVVPVRENDEVKYMTILEVNATALYSKAAKGDPRALATLFALTQKGDVVRAQHIQHQIAVWQDYKDSETAKILEAKARGEPVPQPLPHPDDIIIDYEKGPRFVGPLVPEEQAMLDHTIRFRDVLILQDALDRRSSTRLNGEPLIEPGGAELFAMVLDHLIRPRFRLSDWQCAWRAMKAGNLPKRALLKRRYEEWRMLGCVLPRGLVFPDLSDMKTKLEQAVAIAKEIHRLPRANKMPLGEWERATAKIIGAYLNGK